ncbi:MAG: pantoate--beta-alanine ligase, partial [Actinomycetota bacterium]|nr:pantoate--beta-alanine ligase [Actinomycetota bacterium]
EMLARDVDPEYAALVDPDSFEPVEELAREGLLALAARIGDVRLIDNALLEATQPKNPRKPLAREAIA